MRLRGRQGRFIAVVVAGWIAGRTWLLWPETPVAHGTVAAAGAAGTTAPGAPPPAPAPSTPATRTASPPPAPLRAALASTPHAAAISAAGLRAGDRPVALSPNYPALPSPDARPAIAADRAARDADTPAPPLEPVSPSAGRSIEATAYLFVRPGSGRATLAPGGSLGGSQIAARVALPLARIGPVRAAIAGRLYAPLAAKGREAALGLDLRLLRDDALHLVVERRIGLDAAGRDAWSAYAAGGLFAEPLPKLVVDAYAQSGIVGLRKRDLFADGALRVGRRAGPLTLGAGLWGAAQPGVSRLDAGPRVALSLPVERHRLTLAVEGRLRVAGRAAPGSGAALTLAADF